MTWRKKEKRLFSSDQGMNAYSWTQAFFAYHVHLAVEKLLQFHTQGCVIQAT